MSFLSVLLGELHHVCVPEPIPTECIGITAGDGREVRSSPIYQLVIRHSVNAILEFHIPRRCVVDRRISR
jgi:hypothetical protein